MNKRVTVVAGLALLVAGFSFGMLVSATRAGDQAEMTPEAMMQKWMEYGAPGKQHQEMAAMAGTWNIAGTSWEYPGADAQTSTMKSKVEPILDGRYMVERVTGSIDMGEQSMPFEGRNLIGFDNLKKKYFFVWVDSWMSGFLSGEGTTSDGGNTITYLSDNSPNPITGGYEAMKLVSKREGPDKCVSYFYKKGPNGEWFKNMELVYTRAN